MFGTYRYVLALMVVIVHTWSSPFSYFAFAGTCAVFGFFMLSGYLMSYVLDQKYLPQKNIRGFYKNRLLRIFPLHILVLLLIVLLNFVIMFAKGTDQHMTLGNTLWEFILFGKEFTYTQIMNPPVWSLAVELEFYALVPFLVRRKILRRLVALASFCYWIAIFVASKSFDPYIYRFMFSSYILFWIGIEIYQYRNVIAEFIQKFSKKTQTCWLIVLATVGFAHVFLGNILFTNEYIVTIIFIILNTLLLMLLSTKKQSPKDSLLGNISFGIFVGHFFIARILSLSHLSIFQPGLILFFSTAILASIASYFIYRFVEIPLQKYKD